LLDVERRRDHDVVAALTVYRTAHRVHHQAARHRLALDGLVHLEFRREGFLGAAVGDEFDADEKPAAADVPDVRVPAQALLQCRLARPHLAHYVVEQFFLAYHPLHGERRSACDRVTEIGVAVLEKSGSVADRVEDLPGNERRPYRLIAAAQPFRDHRDIRDYA